MCSYSQAQTKYVLRSCEGHELPVGESVALFNHELGVNVVYTRNDNKKFVTIIRTEHNAFSYVEKTKIEAHMMYNASKGGVDTFDQMCAATNVARGTNRWPQVIFYHLINLVINNAFICYSSPLPKPKDRHKFNSDLALQLARPFAQWRLNVRGLHLQGQPYKYVIESIFKVSREQEQQPVAVEPVEVVPQQLSAAAVFQRPQIQVTQHDVAVPPHVDPRYQNFVGGRKLTNRRQRCLFGIR